MSRALRSASALVIASVALVTLARAEADDVASRRLIRVEIPMWRRLLHAPALLVDAFHWPLKRLLFWGESVRIDRRIRDAVLWKDNDDLPIAEPAADDESKYVWWDVYRHTWLEPLERAVDLGTALPALGRAVGVVASAEAPNVNALDETPDSTWFTNRQGVRPFPPEAVAAGPAGESPAPGPLVVESSKALGSDPGLWVRDAEGRRYLLKFDPRGFPDLATGAELVSSRILHALGWNVPRYDVVRIDPGSLAIGEHAIRHDEYQRERPLTADWLERLFATLERAPDGSLRALASAEIAGVPKGGFAMSGVRADDPNDTVPHEERRDLRGLEVVAAWLDHVDFRTGNTLDTFIREPDGAGRGHLVHFLVDLNGTLGSWGSGWKEPWMGHEAVGELLPAIARGLRLERPGWQGARPGRPAIGRFEGEHFDPERWKPLYPAPPFDRATLRDRFWGARLVTSLREPDLRALVGSMPWTDPAVAGDLVAILRQRQKAIARAYFAARRICPLDGPSIADGELRLRDLAVWSEVVEPSRARYRARVEGRIVESERPVFRLPAAPEPIELTVEASHDEGRQWSPPLRLVVRGNGTRTRVVRLERMTR